MYKLNWMMVSAIAHPEFYRGEHPIVKLSEVPEELWHYVERTGQKEDILLQRDGLLHLIKQGELIKDVHVFKNDEKWVEVT